MRRVTSKEFIQWDVVNWSRALTFWRMPQSKSCECLELGARKGGLSLWLALGGHRVVCSDLQSPIDKATPLHRAFGADGSIRYEAIDARHIPYRDHFDIVIFKSLLGGVSREDHTLQQAVIDEIYKCLKPGGTLLFAENLAASNLHRAARRQFVTWGSRWDYLKLTDVQQLLKAYRRVDIRAAGFAGAFGQKEWQRQLLGSVDRWLDWMIPPTWRYIVFGAAQK